MKSINFLELVSGNGAIVGASTEVKEASSVNVQVINPNGATFKVIVEGSIDGEHFGELGLIVNLKTGGVTKSNGIINSDIHQVDLGGLHKIRASIISTSSEISVIGKFVD